MQIKAGIYVDGVNFYSGWKAEKTPPDIDMGKLRSWLGDYVGATDITVANYYAAVDLQTEAGMRLTGFFSEARKNGFVVKQHIKSGPRDRCADADMIVDVLTNIRQTGATILVTSAPIFLPVLLALHKTDPVWVACWNPAKLNREMATHCRGVIDLRQGVFHFGATDKMSPDDMLAELAAAEVKFTGGYVGLHFFINQWRSPRLSLSAEARGTMIKQLAAEGRIEIYETADGNKGVRLVKQAAG